MSKVMRLAILLFIMAGIAMAFSNDPAMAKKKKIPADFSMPDTGDSKPVIFSHEKHVEKVEKCTACHVKIFKMKKGKTAAKKGKLTMKAMQEGTFCGACHNGETAFELKSEESCVKCHAGGG